MLTSEALTARAAEPGDVQAIATIYNQGIEDRVGTFETEPRTTDHGPRTTEHGARSTEHGARSTEHGARSTEQIEAWFDHAKVFVAVEGDAGEVVGYAVAHPYADRCCYSGIGEFSVYVRRDAGGTVFRGRETPAPSRTSC